MVAIDKWDVYTQWEIEEPDGTKRRIISGSVPIDQEEQRWGRTLLTIALVVVFAIAFLASLVYGFVNSDFGPLDLVWRILGPVLGISIGYYFAPRR